MDSPPCTIQEIRGLDMVAIICFFGVLVLAAVVLVLKGLESLAALRARRLDALHRR